MNESNREKAERLAESVALFGTHQQRLAAIEAALEEAHAEAKAAWDASLGAAQDEAFKLGHAAGLAEGVELYQNDLHDYRERIKDQDAEIERLKELLAITGRAHDTAVEKWGHQLTCAEAAEAKVKELEEELWQYSVEKDLNE